MSRQALRANRTLMMKEAKKKHMRKEVMDTIKIQTTKAYNLLLFHF